MGGEAWGRATLQRARSSYKIRACADYGVTRPAGRVHVGWSLALVRDELQLPEARLSGAARLVRQARTEQGHEAHHTDEGVG